MEEDPFAARPIAVWWFEPWCRGLLCRLPVAARSVAEKSGPGPIMEINGEFDIPASRQRVWEALNDLDVLAQCIPGCESIERESDTEMLAKMKAKIGPVKARFESRIRLSNLNPPRRDTISGEGKGGPAGFGKGSADVTLAETDSITTLRYIATLQVGGKLAQIGSRLVGGAARKIANDFFSKFAEVVANPAGSD